MSLDLKLSDGDAMLRVPELSCAPVVSLEATLLPRQLHTVDSPGWRHVAAFAAVVISSRYNLASTTPKCRRENVVDSLPGAFLEIRGRG